MSGPSSLQTLLYETPHHNLLPSPKGEENLILIPGSGSKSFSGRGKPSFPTLVTVSYPVTSIRNNWTKGESQQTE
jgi:hypothetical protein